MSTRCYIARQIGENQYRAIYCHCDGYLTYTGALLCRFYNTPEMVDALLALGDLLALKRDLSPDPDRPHGLDYESQQRGVTLAYGRDGGAKNTEAKIMTLAEMDEASFYWPSPGYTYIFTPKNEWKYFQNGQLAAGYRDVKADLERDYAEHGDAHPEVDRRGTVMEILFGSGM